MRTSNTINRIKSFGNSSLFTALLLTALFLTACNQVGLYEKNKPIANNQWKGGEMVTGSIDITDTLDPYNVYIVLRHTDAYQYNNIWLNIGLQPPGDTMQYKKFNIILGTDAKGWEGAGMDDIWEVRRMVVAAAPVFKKKGTYHFSIGQVMRDDPLQNIMSAGLRVEKANP